MECAEPNEKSHTQEFWYKLINRVFGIVNQWEYIEFEKRVLVGRMKFIDAYIPSTGIVIEQKSPDVDLFAPAKQSDGSMLTPFEQAKRYYDWLPVSQKGRYILTCNFKDIHIHDMEEPSAAPKIIHVEEATKDNLSFLLTPGETLPRDVKISVEAGQHVKALYEYLLESLAQIASENHYDKEQYDKARNEINVFCVRLVFLLYAEDSGLFHTSQFTNYLKERAIMAEQALKALFAVLRTDDKQRDPYLDLTLKAFPYVNGGLFHDDVRFPLLDDEAKRIILNDMAGFNWAGINPTIFGAIFEATLNDDTRRQEGIHYTSSENIHKLIDPLFLDELTETLKSILDEPDTPARTKKLLAFQDKLATLRFLDPACGSGNFLTESFTSLRRLENSILDALPENETRAVKVSITQFHGIEKNDFAANIARTALWISDHQMWKETQDITHSNESPLPLVDYHHIKRGNAMHELPDLGWKKGGWKIDHDDMLYIMGNPPFTGYSQQTSDQKIDVNDSKYGSKKLDYVACWFKRAAEEIYNDKNIKAAFVATNSVCQGEQVAAIFKFLRENYMIQIDFAYQSFVWKNELPDKKKMAHVHVVIIGFSKNPPAKRKLYTADGMKEVDSINFYLHEGSDNDIAEPTDTPICANVPAMRRGSQPTDGTTKRKGNLIMTDGEMRELVTANPGAKKFIRPFMMGDDFIQRKPRYCLWLVGANPDDIRKCPRVKERIDRVKAFRKASTKPATQRKAATPTLFDEIVESKTQYVAIPLISSEKREYIPIGWLSPEIIPGNGLRIIPDTTLYDFGVLTSRVHMAWMRRVSGRFEMRYIYSNTIVYNTFAWPMFVAPSVSLRSTPPLAQGRQESGRGSSPLPRGEQKGGNDHYARITETAQMILDARALYPHTSFAAMYDDSLMPQELRRAHDMNDRAVCRAYGWSENISEDEIVAGLFKLYHMLVGK